MHRALVLISPNEKLIGRYRTGDIDNLDSFHVDPTRHLCRATSRQPIVAVRSNDGLGLQGILRVISLSNRAETKASGRCRLVRPDGDLKELDQRPRTRGRFHCD